MSSPATKTSGLKVVLIFCAICVGAGVLLVGVVGALVYVNRDTLTTRMTAEVDDARAFATTTDTRGCEEEAIRRTVACSGITCGTKGAFFFGACSTGASRTPGYCDDVPSQFDIVRMTTWPTEHCRAPDGTVRDGCIDIASALPQYCDQVRRRG